MRPAGDGGGDRRTRSGRRRSAGRTDTDPPEDRTPAEWEAAAKATCLRLLTLRSRTRRELHDALVRRGVPEDVIETVLGRFTEVGLIDDATFAEHWVASRHRNAGMGRRALSAELSRKGVAAEMIKEAVGALDTDTEEATARRLVDRRLAGMTNLAPEVKARRLVAMLARKGYAPGLASQVVRAALSTDALDEEYAEALDSLAAEETDPTTP
ncbi:MAG: regulatory protein RecX [Mycobacteriales bacterium]